MNSGSQISDLRLQSFTNSLAYQIADLAWRISDRRFFAKKYPVSADFYDYELNGLGYALDAARNSLRWLNQADRRAVCAKAREFSARQRERFNKAIEISRRAA